MKHSTRLWTLVLLLMLAVLPVQSVYAKSATDGKFVFGSTYTVKSGETLDGDLVVFGGVATVEAGGSVAGSVVVIGGSMTVNGDVSGDAVIIGGAASLGASAVVHGNMVTVGGALQRADGARVLGQVINATGPALNGPKTPNPVIPKIPVPSSTPPFGTASDQLGRIAWAFFQSVVLAALAMVIVVFLPQQTQRVAQAAVGQPLPAGGIGCLTVILAPVAIILLAITLLLLPVAAIAVVVLVAAAVFGEIALGLEVGQRLIRAFNREAPLPVAALVGTFLLALLLNLLGLSWWGWLVAVLVTILALGGVVMTRFGMRAALPPVPAAPPAAPGPTSSGSAQ